MLRKFLGVVVAMALPSLLAGQAPAAPTPAASKLAPAHAVATQVQGSHSRCCWPSAPITGPVSLVRRETE
jgi:hypothetical protein